MASYLAVGGGVALILGIGFFTLVLAFEMKTGRSLSDKVLVAVVGTLIPLGAFGLAAAVVMDSADAREQREQREQAHAEECAELFDLTPEQCSFILEEL